MSLGDTHLRQFDAADGDELRRVRLPDYMRRLRHAVESPTGTFVVSHRNKPQYQVSEGQVSCVSSAVNSPGLNTLPLTD